jgi:S1-C subfamily serine protease
LPYTDIFFLKITNKKGKIIIVKDTLLGIVVFIVALFIFSALSVATIPNIDERGTWKVALTNKIMPAIVQIRVDAYPPPTNEDDEYPERPQHWAGSGIVVSPDGLVISAYHVLAYPDWTLKIVATFMDGHKETLKVLKLWKEHDLSLAQLPKQKTPRPFVKISHRTPLIGEEVLVMGNPYDLGHSVSSGIVSALGRKFYLRLETFPFRRWVFIKFRKGQNPPPKATQMVEMIQFDAPLNPGNSGGGLFDQNGELVGQTNAGIAGDGIGFAVPAKFIHQFLKEYFKQKV